MVHRKQSLLIGNVATRLSNTKLREFLEGKYLEFINVDSAVHVNKISRQPIDFAQHILGGVQQVITQSCLIVISIGIMILFDARVFLFLFLVLLPPVILVFYVIKSRLRSVRKSSQVSIEKSWQHLREALSGFVESNIYNKNNFFISRYIRYQRDFNKYVSELLIIQGIPSRLIEIFALLGLFLLIAMNNSIGGAAFLTITAFMAGAYKIIPGIVKVLNTVGQINNYAYTLDDLQTITKAQPEKPTTSPVKKIRSIRMHEIEFTYNGSDIVSGFNFAIGEGDFVGIAGSSGKGKTTIINLLLGLLEPQSGEITINGKRQLPPNISGYWQKTSYAKQENFIIHDSILRNIILDEPYDEERLEHVIHVTGLDRIFDDRATTYHKLIMENGKNLSGGQRQRIAIARALYKDADLIVLDEPFNELDEATESKFLDHFSNLAQQGKMIILITHNKESFRYCNKVISLDEQLA